MGKLSCDLCRLLFGGGQSDCDEVGLHAAPAITLIHGCDFERRGGPALSTPALHQRKQDARRAAVPARADALAALVSAE